MGEKTILKVEDLKIQIPLDEGILTAVRGASFSIKRVKH